MGNAVADPSPANSTVPVRIKVCSTDLSGLPDPDAAFTVVVRDENNDPMPGVVVEVDGGEVAVEHELTNADLGRTTSPCSTTVSTTWSFAWGVTTRGNRELLVFMNPFPDDATVTIDFATDEGTRQTLRFQNFVVPGRSVVGAFVDQDVTRKAQVSAQIAAGSGRVVVDRIQTVTGQSVGGNTTWYKIQRGALVGFVSAKYANCAE